VVLAGNSIGGFISSTVAINMGSNRVKGLVLLNSAGIVDGPYLDAVKRDAKTALLPQTTPPKPNLLIANLVSQGLFWYLKRSVKGTLGRVYPTRPENVDEYLEDEIARASYDPGALGVFRSVFFLPKPFPLSYNIDVYGGNTYVLQGALDPLNDAPARARQIQKECTNPLLKMELIQAGHCE
jgi:pimeloyl-ACP methyl ester carboxylesterase